jgi:mono/diheme cytochrome c family protein
VSTPFEKHMKPLTLAAVLAVLGAAPGTTRAAEPGHPGPATKPARDPAQIFATTCGFCHHKGGREAGKGPQLMGTPLSDGEIVQRIRKGKPGFMPGYEGAFSEEELAGLVRYIRALRPR